MLTGKLAALGIIGTVVWFIWQLLSNWYYSRDAFKTESDLTKIDNTIAAQDQKTTDDKEKLNEAIRKYNNGTGNTDSGN